MPIVARARQTAKRRTARSSIEVFKLNVEAFPQGFNTYDSPDEAYMNAGQRDLAIKSYKRSLELNPENKNAVEILKKLGTP